MALSKREKLAGHLLNLYWIGAGDAGTDRFIFKFHELIGLPPEHVSSIENALMQADEACSLMYDGKRITQREYFLIIADGILANIEG